MEKVKITRVVRYVEMDGTKGFAIMDIEGDLEVFYPAPQNYLSGEDVTQKLIVSSAFFRYIADLQDMGVDVQFDL